MKTFTRAVVVAGIVAGLAMVPAEVANAYWGPGYGAWRAAYVHDPAYRWGNAQTRNYIRDLYLRGPEYAAWRQQRRYGWWW